MSFFAQTIPGSRLVLKIYQIILIFITISMVFLIVGFAVLKMSWNLPEIQIDYTNCDTTPLDTDYIYIGSSPLKDVNLGWTSRYNAGIKQCIIDFYVPETINNPFLYYQLDNFYQSARSYAKSISFNQLKGKAIKDASQLSECDEVTNSKIVYPCGRIANTIFNDTLIRLSSIPRISEPDPSDSANLLLDKNNKITLKDWKSRDDLFKNTDYDPSDVIPPVNWAVNYTKDNISNITTSNSFRVWSLISPFPKFRKLWAQMDQSLQPGYYRLIINDNYPSMTSYGSSKTFILTTTNIFGGRNTYLGLICILCGLLYLFGGIIFYVKNKQHPRELGDAHLLDFYDDMQPSPVAQSLDHLNDYNVTIKTVQRRKTRDYQ
eukprot:NODE_334_length_9322_cov_0.874458.p2 type:complete len:376 gc:universal NODE_334_length_9322_cov_0.874458:1480-353(-)